MIGVFAMATARGEAEDAVEREGVRRAWAALEKAELILFLADDRHELSAEDQALLARLPAEVETLLLFNKCDLSGRAPGREVDAQQRVHLRLSAASGAGVALPPAAMVAGAAWYFSTLKLVLGRSSAVPWSLKRIMA